MKQLSCQPRIEDCSQHYELDSRVKIGSGSFAIIYKVKRKVDDQYFALKWMKNNIGENARKRILEECALSKVCGSNYVVQVEEIFDHCDRIHVFFEMMDRNMKSLPRIFNEDFCKYSIYCVAKGLQIMHSKNILHRDLKSENILCNSLGQVKIADLGLSIFLTDQETQR